MKGSERNKKCPCGSGKKWKKCHPEKEDGVPEKVMQFFSRINHDRAILKNIGINSISNQAFSKTQKGYMTLLDNRVFEFETKEDFEFYDLINLVTIETLGNKWIEEESKLPAKDRSYLYKMIHLLAPSTNFKKIIAYTDDKRKDLITPGSGFSKDFRTLAFDIFCLRNSNSLPEKLIKRLRIGKQYQGARYEITIAAIFVRLGYKIEWIDDNSKIKHPEFIAKKDNFEIYVEAKSRHIKGDQNSNENFDLEKAMNSNGGGGLLYKALQKKVPKNKFYMICIDINAIDDDKIPPKWLDNLHKSIKKQHNKNFIDKANPGTAVIFTNFSYHYYGLDETKNNHHMIYNGDSREDPLIVSKEFNEIANAIKWYGFIPDFHLPEPTKRSSKAIEYPKIKNIYYPQNNKFI